MEGPKVTGLSPREGQPGTRVTIRGERLGKSQQDIVSVIICDKDCTLFTEWRSSSKIVTRSPAAKGKGDVIVTTRSGGRGTSTVTFTAKENEVGPLQDSAVWVDEISYIEKNIIHRRKAGLGLSAGRFDDPLGLSDEVNDIKFPEDSLAEMFPDGSGDIKADTFHPVWFLLENHAGTAFSDLQAGFIHLKRKYEQRAEGPKSLAKASLGNYIDSQDALKTMHAKLVEDQTLVGAGKAITEPLVDILNETHDKAENLFGESLKRKDRADTIRNAIKVLTKFRFLFNLPCNMDKNVARGDYEVVINDYMRAKNLFMESEVDLFQRVYKEVEERKAKLEVELREKLLTLPANIDDQKKIVRHLVDLESPGDPAWDCLENQHMWLVQMLHDCKEEHLGKEREEAKHPQPKTPMSGMTSSTSSWRLEPLGNSRLSSASSPVDHIKAWIPPFLVSSASAPAKVAFVEAVSDVLVAHLPNLWRLGQAYFSGHLVTRETGERARTIDTSKHAKFRTMVVGVAELFANLLRAAFLPSSVAGLPHETRRILGAWNESQAAVSAANAWLPRCVRYIRQTLLSLSEGLAEAPPEMHKRLQDLALDLRTHCMAVLFTQATDEIKNLHLQESWRFEEDEEAGAVTQLPYLFENVVMETLQLLKDVVMSSKPGETEMFHQRVVQKDATELCTNLLRAFAACLDKAVFEEPSRAESPVKSRALSVVSSPANRKLSSPARSMPRTPNHGLNTPAHSAYGASREDLSLDLNPHPPPSPPLGLRVLITLSNMAFTRNIIVPRLVESCSKYGYPASEKILASVEASFDALDDRLFEAFVDRKLDPILGALEPGVLAGKYDFALGTPEPSGVRAYVIEALMSMIDVIDEVSTVNPQFVPKVLAKIVEKVSEELNRIIQCVDAFSLRGAIQARLDLTALSDALHHHKTEESAALFQEALDFIPPSPDVNEAKKLDDLVQAFKSKCRFQLLIFQNCDSASASPARPASAQSKEIY